MSWRSRGKRLIFRLGKSVFTLFGTVVAVKAGLQRRSLLSSPVLSCRSASALIRICEVTVMEYHLYREGQHEGVFPLEEIAAAAGQAGS